MMRDEIEAGLALIPEASATLAHAIARRAVMLPGLEARRIRQAVEYIGVLLEGRGDATEAEQLGAWVAAFEAGHSHDPGVRAALLAISCGVSAALALRQTVPGPAVGYFTRRGLRYLAQAEHHYAVTKE